MRCGGYPRLIQGYITNSLVGLNWEKIGDSPSQGNYIIETAEEAHPSDLILSNLMSFGKPYIMSLDGWILIRDTKKVFDLTFLCHLLLGQYLERFDYLIPFHWRKYEELQKTEKFMLQNMFV